MTLVRLLVALAFAVTAASATAQATAADAALPKSTCVKPSPYPGKKAQDDKKSSWQKDVTTWGDCVKKYVAELRAHVDATVKVANAAIEEYNSGIKELQDGQKTAEGITDK